MKKALKIFSWMLIAVFLAVLSVPMVFYLYGRSMVVDSLNPPERLQNEKVVAVYKKWLGMPDSSMYKKLNPYSFVVLEIPRELKRGETGDIRKPYMELYLQATEISSRKRFDLRQYPERFVAEASALIYISRNWTVDEIISEVLHHQYFGRSSVGLDKASELYFGVRPIDLDENHLFVLFSLPRSANSYDPWCRTENLKRLVVTHFEERGMPYSWSDLNLLPNPDGNCK